MANKKIIIGTSIASVAIITTSLIVVPIVFNKREDFKNDGVIEIWTTNSEKDQFYNSFNDQFINEFNKTSEYKVEMVTVTPQESLAADIAIKMGAKDKVPNLFIGKPGDSVYLIDEENDFAKLMDITDYSDSLILDNYIPLYDDYQDSEIIPFAPLMVNGEALYINKLQMNSFIKYIESTTSIIVMDEFKSLFDYSEAEEYNIYFDESKVTSNTILDDFNVKYSSTIDETIFDSVEGVVDLSRLIKSLFLDEYQTNNTLGFDNDVSSAEYMTYNYVGNDFEKWFFNTKNETNFVDSIEAQDTYSLFVDAYQSLIDEGVMWVRENDSTNPTGPFINDELTMFIGANFNAKYINSTTEENLQYDESVIIGAPRKVMSSQTEEYVFLKSKTLNAISLGSEEDEVAGEFVDFVLSGLNTDYDFYIDEGYLPPITNIDDFRSFTEYINNESNFIDADAKKQNLVSSLRATSNSILEGLETGEVSMFEVPQLKTTLIFESLIFEANRMHSGEEAVDYIIDQIKANT